MPPGKIAELERVETLAEAELGQTKQAQKEPVVT